MTWKLAPPPRPLLMPGESSKTNTRRGTEPMAPSPLEYSAHPLMTRIAIPTCSLLRLWRASRTSCRPRSPIMPTFGSSIRLCVTGPPYRRCCGTSVARGTPSSQSRQWEERYSGASRRRPGEKIGAIAAMEEMRKHFSGGCVGHAPQRMRSARYWTRRGWRASLMCTTGLGGWMIGCSIARRTYSQSVGEALSRTNRLMGKTDASCLLKNRSFQKLPRRLGDSGSPSTRIS
mmetsp:Transcript_30414/g.64563  ORF Transcript_30414/g.64563 Transcript_30414/m.64563 type:complete len:231 (-) Transcript_30414:280-972(-)